MAEHLGKAKVSYLGHTLMKQYVFALEIPVDNSFFMQAFEPIDDLLEKVGSLILCESFTQFFLDVVLERPFIAVLHNNQHRSVGPESIDKFDDVGVIAAGLHDFDLSLCEFLDLGVFEMLHRNGFYCYVVAGGLVKGFIDSREGSFSDHSQKVVGSISEALETFLRDVHQRRFINNT